MTWNGGNSVVQRAPWLISFVFVRADAAVTPMIEKTTIIPFSVVRLVELKEVGPVRSVHDWAQDSRWIRGLAYKGL